MAIAWIKRYLFGTPLTGNVPRSIDQFMMKLHSYIVGSVPMLPESINSMKWGGFVKDIKGRDTTKYQFATSGQKMIYLWKLDAKSGTFEQEFINTGSTIRQYLCLSFSKNREDYLFAGTSSGDFCAFQIKNKLLSSITNVCALGITSILSVTPELLVVGGGDGTVAAFHVEGHIITPLAKVSLPGTVNAISCSPDGVQLLTATDRGFVHRLKSADLTTVLQCENHTDSVVFIAYPDGVSDKFASCSEDGTIRRWDVNDYIVEGRCIGNSAGSPLCLVYADEVMLSGWEDGKIRMFRNDKNTQVWQIDNAHKGGVPTIALASNMKFLCSGGAEGGVRVWEMRSREMVSHLKEHTNRVTKVKLFDDDMHLLSSSRDKALLCWDLRAEKRISAHIQRMGGINCFDIVPGKNIVLTTGQDRKITYWDLREANPAKSYDTNSNPKKGDECMGLAISHDGRYFATGGSEQIVRLWDLAAGKVLAEGTGHSGCINTVAFSADDKQIVSGGRDGSILVWNLYL